ncbi:NSP-interacting syntaxin domain-containing protein [Hibiscus trionum]|uniref:NSP-interacting syntaxin domain-containing protein n=1 Tax=Hibiscus trionum TaxID=183268 RepID=A0A9W7MGY7_HIBTR|nr:NSP-interacting syntaxin domain-containing protein [Hibiscus trionum]
MVANSFDLWQKDAFFSAAEEVQESADIMESAYRVWIKEKREGLETEGSTELCRELQTALGTAKWQLEEFERAIRLSHGHRSDDITATRHKQFIAAIESQISRVEAAFKEAFSKEGKQPLRWVNLDEEECDDLAIFLSGTSPTLPAGTSPTLPESSKNTPSENCHRRKDADSEFNAACNGDTSEVKIAKESSKDAECVIDVEGGETSGRADHDVSCGQDRTTGTRKTWSSPNFGALRIVIADECDNRSQIRSGIESTPKEKGSKHFFRKQRCGDLPQARGAFNLFYQCSGSIGGLLRHLQSPVHLQFSCSLQLTFVLLIAIFLIVPFVLYAS